MKDIFSDMQARIGCSYLSDLPYNKQRIYTELTRLLITEYDEKQLNDFSRYVFNVDWITLQAAIKKKKLP